MKKITIIGAGAFGFAFARLIGQNHIDKEVFVYDVNENFIKHLHEKREHPVFHKGKKMPNHVNVTHSLEEAVKNSNLIIMAVPSRFLRKALMNINSFVDEKTIFLSLIKGLEEKTNKRASEIIEEIVPEHEICVLSGGMIAKELTDDHPLCADLACNDKKLAKKIAKLMWNDYLRIETTEDVIGVELAGAFKNVIAIGAGLFDGCGYGESSKSAFISAAAKEMTALALKLGAKEETFGPGSQAWLGDLMTTCFGGSRNREFGELIGKGVLVKDAVEKMLKKNKSIEGYLTSDVVHNISKGNETPLIEMLYNLLYNGLSPKDFVNGFIKNW